ncbi:glycosyltransferase family 39 protein [Candidatus Shapirobacteria bacterium]|nr:glycosyltransferase family 39 protein [Candidatus Shapirobacteria bacterium]
MKKKKVVLFLIFLLGLVLRVYGLNWDQGHHLHPDERMIIMVVERLKWGNLNPKFFAYGSLPLYLLKAVSALVGAVFGPRWAGYSHLVYLGRAVSAFFDLGTLLLIFKIGKRIWGEKVGFWASFLYATCVFPIQASHFYAVDTPLNFFIWLTLWFLLKFYQKLNFKNALKVGIGFGLALSTKVSAAVLLVPVGLALVLGIKTWPAIKKRVLGWGGLIVLTAFFTFALFEPYAFLDFTEFKKQILAQQRMTKDAYIFPYTLQYVGTVPYFYHLKNMVLWGMGLALGGGILLGVAGYLGGLLKRALKKGDYDKEALELVLVVFGLAYFFVVGKFAVKFMRYLLPLYPWFILLGVVFWEKTLQPFKGIWKKALLGILLFFHFVWLIAFMGIYTQPHSRVEASLWLENNIPPGSFLAVEHWDDRLPLRGGEKFEFVDMPMYEPDSNFQKWEIVKNNLEKADYLILASNRLFTPLQKLGDCERFERCYPKTAQYYQDLFSGKSGFEKVAEFTSYPRLKIGNWKLEIDDQTADESFTVYDHPKVIIFRKE